MKLLSREEFRDTVLKRDNFKCVLCQNTKDLSVHHILERKLWKDDGYYESNGATLCPKCHIEAESCFVMPYQLWTLIGIDIDNVLYPKGLNGDVDGMDYDKWGQVVAFQGSGEFIVIPNRFEDEFSKAVRMAGGITRIVSREWVKQYYHYQIDIDVDKFIHAGKLRHFNTGT